ncbi:MAG: N-formylglutamate amidohydrolase [Acidobacteriota bacterium]
MPYSTLPAHRRPRPEITDHHEPIEWVAFDDAPGGEDEVLVYTIHDGGRVPRHIWGERTDEVLDLEPLREAFVRERDWGADRVASHVARRLGLSGFLRVDLPRFVLDFGRFPGVSTRGDAYLLRRSIFPPVENLLDEATIHRLMREIYDRISTVLTERFARSRLTFAIHTYDRHNASGTLRPEISLVERSMTYQRDSSLPPYTFDPLFPALLLESTCDRLVTYRLLLELERAGWHAALDYPYSMPEGSVEIRAQVWFFFRHLREHFVAARPETSADGAYQRVWQMLLDVNRRLGDCERLRAYLHRYRDAPPGQEELYRAARQAYGEIGTFLAARREELVDGWRFSAERPGCFGIEVRKDLLIESVDDVLAPRADADETADAIARHVATAVDELRRTRWQRPNALRAATPAAGPCAGAVGHLDAS